MNTNQNQTCRPATAGVPLQLDRPMNPVAADVSPLHLSLGNVRASLPRLLRFTGAAREIPLWGILALTLWLGCLPGLLAQAVPDRLNYQGILLKGDGSPVPAVPTDVEFRIWDLPENGTLLWGRTHRLTPDTNGAFNVVLMEGGAPITAGNPVYSNSLAPVFTGTGSDARYLELTVAGSTAIRPRQRFVASPYAFLANGLTDTARQNFTVSDTLTVAGTAHIGSLTASGAASVGSLTASGGTVTASNFVGYGTIPIGGIIMWSGTNVPTGWALCNGTQGTPDLRDRFIVGAGGLYALEATGGTNTVVLTTNQVPLLPHMHTYDDRFDSDKAPGSMPDGSLQDWVGYDTTGSSAPDREPDGDGSVARKHMTRDTGNSSITSGIQSHENRPPYYALAFIMRIR